jgi:exopolysaccharide biosynthesis polyprenyl glycosylphosphotransferase
VAHLIEPTIRAVNPTVQESDEQFTPRPVTLAVRPPNDNWRPLYAWALLLGDILSLTLGVIIASIVRFRGLDEGLAGPAGLSFEALGVLGALAWVATLGASGAYGRRIIGSGPEEWRRVCNGALRYFALVAAAVFITKVSISRSFVAIAIPLAFLFTIAIRHYLRRWLYRQRVKGRYTRSVVVVGGRTAVRALIEHFQQAELAEFVVVGVCTPEAGALVVDHDNIPVLGGPTDVFAAVVTSGADVIAVADADTLGAGGFQRLARQIEGRNLELMAVPSLTDVAGPRITVSNAAGLPLLSIGTPELRGSRRFAKSAFERAVAFAAIVMTAPVLLLIALLVRLTSPGPAIFRQERVGLNGKRFHIWKFRTMDHDADSRLSEVIHLNEIDSILYKSRADPRITAVGRRLRKWSLDELPQLWNVLRGEMSLVGPRPPLPSEVERYGEDANRRLLVKPGITGLWQVSGRSSLSWEQSVQLDLHYIENWSLTMDLVLLAKTIKAVALRKGAW